MDNLNYEHFICKTYVSKIFIDVNETFYGKKSTIKIVVTTALEILVVCLSSAVVAMILLAPFDDELLRVGLGTSEYERTRIKQANKRAKTRHRELGDGNSHMTTCEQVKKLIDFDIAYRFQCLKRDIMISKSNAIDD